MNNLMLEIFFLGRFLVQNLIFLVWAIELEIETLFIGGPRNELVSRLKFFPAKLGVRLTFLILGGYYAGQLKKSAYHCEKSQNKVLENILKQGRLTAFGRDHGFSAIQSYDDFIKALPIMGYSEHEPYIDRQMRGERDAIVPGKPVFYATTSGTTGKPKYIPVTAEAAKRSHKQVSLIWFYYLARRNIGFLDDFLVGITGQAIEGYTPDGTPFGSTSGQLRRNLPKFLQSIYAVPEEVFQIEDYESRYYCLALFSLRVKISQITSANPSTLLILFEVIMARREELINDIETGSLLSTLKLAPDTRKRLELKLKSDLPRANELRDTLKVAGFMDPAYYWPRLSSLGCWKGGNSPVFIDRLRKLIPDVVPILDLGYLASEVRATVPVEKLHHGGIPTLHRNFFEFIPVEKWLLGDRNTIRLHELELGERYYVLITTDSGLYRYNINDIVRVVGFFGDTPEIVFEQKGDGVTNLTGEKLYEQQVQMAFSSAALEVGLPMRFFLCLLNKAEQRYEFLVELAEDGNSNLDLKGLIDQKIGEYNIEYRSKRDSLRLKNPKLHFLTKGSFARYRQKKINEGQREAQFKMVLLSSKIELLNEFTIETTQ